MNRFPGLISVTAALLVLSAACGGKDSSPPPNQSGGVARLGTAEAGAAVTPAATAVSAGQGTAGAAAAVAPSPAAASPAGATRPSPAASPVSGGRAATPGSGAAAAVVVTPHPDTPDPCGLVTLAEAEAAVGGRPFPGRARRSRDTAEVQCSFDYLAGGRSAIIGVWKGSEARAVYDLRRSMYGQGATVEEVRGLGDRAFVVKGDEGWVNVLRGDVYVSIQVVNQTPAAEQSLGGEELRGRTMALARAAVGRL